MYRPLPFDRRFIAQSGVFTCHSDPQTPLDANEVPPEAQKGASDGINLAVLRVRGGKYKSMLQRQLNEIDISRKTLFPDMEGLSEFVNWGTAAIASRRAQKSKGANEFGS